MFFLEQVLISNIGPPKKGDLSIPFECSKRNL